MTPEPDSMPTEDTVADGEQVFVVDMGSESFVFDPAEETAPADDAVAPVGEEFEGRPVVTLETELWADAFPVKPPPAEGAWQAVKVKEYMQVYAARGLVVAYPGHFLVREEGAESMDFICLPPEAFAEQYTAV